MARALNEFLAAATANNIRVNNQYEVECMSGFADIDKVLNKAVMFGQNFSIPGRSHEYASVSFKGFECGNLAVTRMVMETEHTMTMVADLAGEYRRAFLAWQNKTINADIDGGSKFEGDRGVNEQSCVRVRLFAKDNETVTETYKFVNARIQNVGPISLTYEGGEKATFDVTFKSTYWFIEESKDGELIGQK